MVNGTCPAALLLGTQHRLAEVVLTQRTPSRGQERLTGQSRATLQPCGSCATQQCNF